MRVRRTPPVRRLGFPVPAERPAPGGRHRRGRRRSAEPPLSPGPGRTAPPTLRVRRTGPLAAGRIRPRPGRGRTGRPPPTLSLRPAGRRGIGNRTAGRNSPAGPSLPGHHRLGRPGQAAPPRCRPARRSRRRATLRSFHRTGAGPPRRRPLHPPGPSHRASSGGPSHPPTSPPAPPLRPSRGRLMRPGGPPTLAPRRRRRHGRKRHRFPHRRFPRRRHLQRRYLHRQCLHRRRFHTPRPHLRRPLLPRSRRVPPTSPAPEGPLPPHPPHPVVPPLPPTTPHRPAMPIRAPPSRPVTSPPRP